MVQNEAYSRRQFKWIAESMVDHCLRNSARGFYSGEAEGQTDITVDRAGTDWRVEWYGRETDISNAAKKYLCRYARRKGIPVWERFCHRDGA